MNVVKATVDANKCVTIRLAVTCASAGLDSNEAQLHMVALVGSNNARSRSRVIIIILGTKRNVVFLIAYLCIVRSAFHSIEHC